MVFTHFIVAPKTGLHTWDTPLIKWTLEEGILARYRYQDGMPGVLSITPSGADVIEAGGRHAGARVRGDFRFKMDRLRSFSFTTKAENKTEDERGHLPQALGVQIFASTPDAVYVDGHVWLPQPGWVTIYPTPKSGMSFCPLTDEWKTFKGDLVYGPWEVGGPDLKYELTNANAMLIQAIIQAPPTTPLYRYIPDYNETYIAIDRIELGSEYVE